MQTFKVIYQHGHFIDVETHQRIIPVQGKEFIITAENHSFTTEDAKLKMPKTLSSLEKEIKVKEKYGKGNYEKIADAGNMFFFRVGNTNTLKEDESRQYMFSCVLLEDLYLYLNKDKSGEGSKDWRLVDCQCKLTNCLLGGLSLTEEVPAKSLNNLFNQTVMFYFSMQRSGSTNVYDNFFVYKENMIITFEGALQLLYKNIEVMRKDVAEKKIKMNKMKERAKELSEKLNEMDIFE